MKLWYQTFLPSSTSRAAGEDDRADAAFKYIDGERIKRKSDIVFIHGTGSNSHMWQRQVQFFTDLGYSCTLIDLRGHGQSHEPNEMTDLNVHRQDVLETLQGSDVRLPAYFVGHSLGAIVALDIAEKNPELVKAVFAACIPAKLLTVVKAFFAHFLNGPMQALRDSPVKRYLPWREQTLLEMPLFTMKEIANFFAKADLLENTPVTQLPVHVGAARFDPLAIHVRSKKLHKKLSVSTFKTFEWAGHNVMDYRPDEFNKWVLKHLELAELFCSESNSPDKSRQGHHSSR